MNDENGPTKNNKIPGKNQMFIEAPYLEHYAKDNDNVVTTGLGITLWQKEDYGNSKPIAYGRRAIKQTEKKNSTGEFFLSSRKNVSYFPTSHFINGGGKS